MPRSSASTRSASAACRSCASARGSCFTRIAPGGTFSPGTPASALDFSVYQQVWRLLGIDQFQINGIGGKYWEPDESFVESFEAVTTPLFSPADRAMPVVCSGQWGGQAPETYARTGRTVDLLYLCGGGIVSHPGGPADGVRAVRQAWEAAVAGVPLVHLCAGASGARAVARDLRRRDGRMSVLLSFYGDDLTGSTDAMEALASQGVPTVLFTAPPSDADLARFPEARAVGVAGTSRSETPAWMDANLPAVFGRLRALDPAICHYKVCSTFDSGPRTGSIGRAAEIGAAAFAQDVVPIVVGAPQLRRYTAFGHLFAGFRQETYRIDRHPVMSRHPVTPMAEADLRLHLAAQTDRPISLVDLAALAGADPDGAVDRVAAAGGLLLLDVADAATQAAAGRQLWRLARAGRRFLVGSSGVEYALLGEWARLGLVPGAAAFPALRSVERIAVVSGSCSPTTEAQIRAALADGFEGVALDPRDLIGGGREAAVGRAIAAGAAVLARGGSPLIYTALGPESDLGQAVEVGGDGRAAIGASLGRILRGLVEAGGLGRAVVAGGDTSSHALRELGIVALTTAKPIPATPGSPVCRAASGTERLRRFGDRLQGRPDRRRRLFLADPRRDRVVAGARDTVLPSREKGCRDSPPSHTPSRPLRSSSCRCSTRWTSAARSRRLA